LGPSWRITTDKGAFMLARNRHRLFIYRSDSKIYEEILHRKLPQLPIHSAGRPEEASPYIEEAEILLSSKVIPDDLLKKARRLVWFASTSAGNDSLVKNPFLPASVTFTKTTIYGEMMAEFVFAYLLYFIRGGSKHLMDQKRKIWDPVRPERLRGKVLAIVGSVGKEIAKRGKQFGMRVIGVRRTPEPVEEVDQIFSPQNLDKMIPQADYLVAVIPFTPETDHLLGEKELALLKEGAVLFNIGRGTTIDEKALIRVLKAKKIRAVLDVFETEPLPPDNELWSLENVIVTPHVSGIDLPEEICEGFVANYERWVKGEPLIGLVDRDKGY
jgi:phosphoglycerate dehydrogenase-like enzyme